MPAINDWSETQFEEWLRDHQASHWTEQANADNAQATATRSGVAGKNHYLSSIIASFSGTDTIATVQIKDGSTIILEVDVHDELDVELSKPIQISEGSDVSAVIDASGTGGNVGKVNIVGYTI